MDCQIEASSHTLEVPIFLWYSLASVGDAFEVSSLRIPVYNNGAWEMGIKATHSFPMATNLVAMHSW